MKLEDILSNPELYNIFIDIEDGSIFSNVGYAFKIKGNFYECLHNRFGNYVLKNGDIVEMYDEIVIEKNLK